MKAIFFLLVLFFCFSSIYCQSVEEFRKSGNAKYRNSDNKGAFTDYSKSIELDPKITGLYLNKALTSVELKDLEGAVFDYTKAIELAPNLPFIYLSRGELKMELEDYRDAISYFTKEIEKDPKSFKSFF